MHSRNTETHRNPGVKRKWLAVKYGLEALKIQDDRHIEDLFFHFRDILNEFIVLEERPVHILFSESISEVFDFLHQVFEEVHWPFPLLLLVDDAERSEVSIQTELAHSFQQSCYIFKVTGSETREMLCTNDFFEFRTWCRDFVENVMIDNVMNDESGNSMQSDNRVHSEEASFLNDQGRRSDEEKYELGVQHVLNALDAYHPDDYESFVANIAVEKFFNQMHLMFDNIADNSHLIQLIRVSLSPPIEIYPRIAAILEQIILHTLNSELILKMCDQVFDELSRSNCKLLWSALEDLMEIFMAIQKFAPCSLENKVQSQWDIFFNFINHIPKWFWNEIPENLVNWLRNKVDEFTVEETTRRKPEPENIPKLERISFQDTQTRPSSTYETPKQFNNFWEACEAEEPPCDFRDLSEIPQIEDIITEEPPYVRRAIVDRKYENSQHYLDVMFRLLREDLISPLRDGIHLHNTMASDQSSIKIYNVLELRGAQVKFNDGVEFRYLVATNNTLDTKSLLFGQIVCLSSDNFRKSFHLGCVVERKDELGMNNIIGIQFFEPFEKDEKESYLLAEPSSYFEAYQHVLKVIKKINRFRSFPMERYLVHCKKDVLKPLYMRLDGDPSNDGVDEDIIDYYEKLRKSQKDILSSSDEKTRKDKIKFLLDSAHPILPVRVKTANEDLRDKITIHGETYAIDKLRENFVSDRLNPNQRDALITALTNELCLIQGPPGTGKTFLGVEIVRAILANRIRFGVLKPVLLVCYTNAALDQFLEKVYKMLTEDRENGLLQHHGPMAVRLGSKSESGLVDKMRLTRSAVVNDFKNVFAENENGKLGRMMRDKRNQAKELSMISSILRLQKTKILRFEVIRPVMSSSHSAEFVKFHTETCPKLLVDEAFGHWLLDKPVVSNHNLKLINSSDGQDFEESRSVSGKKEDPGEEDVSLAELFRRMNIINSGAKEVLEKVKLEQSQLETSIAWDLTLQVKLCDNDVILFGKMSENGYNKIVYDSQILSAVLECESQILKTKPLSQSEAANINSILTITRTRRWELYSYWIDSLESKVLANLPYEIQKYQGICRDAQHCQQAVDVAVLKNSLIIGATTTGAAKFNDLLSTIGSKVVIIEESAEVLEGHCFASIPNTTEHLVMIGDHQQLRPNPSVHELGKLYNLNVSMFERLIMNDVPYTCLSIQHRMLPMLTSKIIRPFFYQNLEDHESVKLYPEVVGMKESLYFWSHHSSEILQRTSYTNRHEVLMISKLVRYLLSQECYSPSEISVITPYAEQQSILDNELNSISKLVGSSDKVIGVHTVDSFQGKENKIIIVSLVRSNGDGIGFLSISNRVCVALTRAKHGMFVVGNIHHLNSKSALWRRISDTLINSNLVEFFIPIKCQVHGNITEIYEPEDFDALAADGGCNEKCGASLGCGHYCSKKCHAGTNHLDGDICRQPCLRTCSNEKYKHKCQNLCNEACGSCYQLEFVKLECGHEVGGACQDLHKLKCKERCSKYLKCGHQCSQKCGEECTEECLVLMPFKQDCNHIAEYLCSNPEVGKCTFPCGKVLKCGHSCPNDCSNPCAIECLSPVPQTLPCGHRTGVPCSVKPELYPCPVEIDRCLERCGHYVKTACSSPLETIMCSTRCSKFLDCGHVCIRQCGICQEEGKHSCGEICRKNLACGHQCMDKCGIPCGSCKADCLTSCSHQACGSPTIGTKTDICYGRQCCEICVLCNRDCDNHCEHRFCQLRCFQVCDVKPCEHTCNKKLSCGHLCLGMCNEVCPTVCGACNEKKYMEIVQPVREMDSKPRVYRLIMIPFCNHIFPVTYLDGIMSNFKQKGVYPRCPQSGCGKAVLGVQRYSRIIKEIVFKRYQQVEKRRIIDNVALKHFNFEKYKAELKQYFKPIDSLAVQSKAGKTRITNLQKLREKWVGNLSVDFLYDLSRSIKSLVYLYNLYFQIETKVPRRSSTCSPNMERICNYIFRTGNIKQDMENLLDVTCAWFNTNMSSDISGVFVPAAKEFLMRAAVSLTICELVVTTTKRCTDIEDSKMSRLSALLVRVNETGSNLQLEDLLKKIVAFINESNLVHEKDIAEWKLFLSIPFPQF